jgi:NADH-ubiquinone oxidoreductase chain 2
MLVLGLLIVYVTTAFSSIRITSITINRIVLILLGFCFMITLISMDECTGAGITLYNGLFQMNSITFLGDLLIYLMAIIIISVKTEESNIFRRNLGEYVLIILFSLLGSSLLISSNDLISLFLSIELQSFGLYLLATYYYDDIYSCDAGLKYFFLGALSSCLILFGSSLIYSLTGLTNISNILLIASDLESSSSSFPFGEGTQLLDCSILIMLIGLMFKISAAPFHYAFPDIYERVPTVVTMYLTIMAKISILVFLWNLRYSTPISFNSYDIFLVSGLLSLIIGTISGLSQDRIKRLLSYSTISHVGFLLLALYMNTQSSLFSSIFYLIQYSMNSANLFLILIALSSYVSSLYLYSPVLMIRQLKGLYSMNAPIVISLSITLLSMAGIPPFIGFFGKQFIIISLIENGLIFSALVAILTSVISTVYYLNIIKYMLDDSEYSDYNPIESINERIGKIKSFFITLITLINFFFILKSSLIINSCHILALSIFTT